jgi:hypothetical protein
LFVSLLDNILPNLIIKQKALFPASCALSLGEELKMFRPATIKEVECLLRAMGKDPRVDGALTPGA